MILYCSPGWTSRGQYTPMGTFPSLQVFKLPSTLVCWSCCNKLPPSGKLKQQKCIFSENNGKPLTGVNEESSLICFEKRNRSDCCIENGLEEGKSESRAVWWEGALAVQADDGGLDRDIHPVAATRCRFQNGNCQIYQNSCSSSDFLPCFSHKWILCLNKCCLILQ